MPAAAAVTIERSARPVAAARIRRVAHALLDASELCAIATATRRGRPHVNTAYFAWAPDLRIVWISDPASSHSRNLRSNPSAAVAVYDSTQTWGTPDRGIQLFGTAREARGDAAEIYRQRFPDYEDGPYRYYELRPRRIKLFDEDVFGAGVFVTARVGANGDVAWQRTELYRQ
jgi:uncharacterized protein YhbP (UPF0306 family)